MTVTCMQHSGSVTPTRTRRHCSGDMPWKAKCRAGCAPQWHGRPAGGERVHCLLKQKWNMHICHLRIHAGRALEGAYVCQHARD